MNGIEQKVAPWPFPTTESMKAKQVIRKEYRFTVEQLAQYHKACDLGSVNVNLFWAQMGKEMGFKWWTVAPLNTQDCGYFAAFTAEVNNAKS